MYEPTLSVAPTVLHASAPLGGSEVQRMLVPLLVLGGLMSVALVGLSALAFSRRGSRSYFLITVALGALALKAVFGGLSLVELLPSGQHHLLEHSMDFTTAALLIAAIYYARTMPNSGERNAEEL